MPNNIGASEVLKMKDKYYLTVNGQDVFLKKLAVSKGSLKKNKKCGFFPHYGEGHPQIHTFKKVWIFRGWGGSWVHFPPFFGYLLFFLRILSHFIQFL